MRKFFILILMISFFSFSWESGTNVSAAPCNPGNYQKQDKETGTFKCTKVDDNAASKNGDNGLNNEDSGRDWVKKFGKFIKALSVTVAYFTQVIAMITISYAAYLYTTSEGNPQKMRQAKMYLLYAFVGLFIGAFSLVISRAIGGIL